MTRFFTILFLVLILYYLLRFVLRSFFSSGRGRNKNNGPEELVQDPHCLTYIPKRSAFKKKVRGQVLYFCGEKCFKSYLLGGKKAFDKL